MKSLSIDQLGVNLTAVLKVVESGQTVVLTRDSKPIAEIHPIGAKRLILGAFADPTGPHLEVSWTEKELDELVGRPEGQRGP